MRRPFGKLILLLREADTSKTIGRLALELDESPERIMDALEADKILSRKPAYIGEDGYVFVDPV